jgi:peroxiredoxin
MPFGGQSQQRWGDNSINAADFIRDFQLTDLSGRVCHSGPTRGKGWILLAFVDASPSSVRVLRSLQALADSYKESAKLTVWAISSENEAITKQTATEAGAQFPMMLDHDGYHAMLYGLVDLPTVFLIASDGTVQRKASGFKPRILNDMSVRYAKFAEVAEPMLLPED